MDTQSKGFKTTKTSKGGLTSTGAFRNVTWNDRESVIENVFAKVNAGVLPVYWRELNVDDLKRAIIKEEERKMQTKEGIVPDDSEADQAIDRALDQE